MADDAAEYDVTLCVENHANTLADTPESTEKLLTEVGRDNVGLILDFTNFWEVEETPPLALIDRFYPWIKHIHAKNAEMFDSDISPYRYVMEEGHDLVQEDAGIRTLADGELDYVEILEDLDRRDFDKFFSIECFETRRSPLRVAKDELEYCQNVINSREQTSRREETVEPSRRSANEPADERAFEL
jgi:3-dehydroshikimate dehydratase